MKSRKQIATHYEITEAYLSMVLNQKRPVSWPFAAKLSDDFPERTIQQWKNAKPEDLTQAFKQLPETETA